MVSIFFHHSNVSFQFGVSVFQLGKSVLIREATLCQSIVIYRYKVSVKKGTEGKMLEVEGEKRDNKRARVHVYK